MASVDDIVPPPSSAPKPRRHVGVAVALTLAFVAAAGTWVWSDDVPDPVPRAAPAEDVPDRTARPVEVLGEVLERPPLPPEEAAPSPAPTSSTTVRPRPTTSRPATPATAPTTTTSTTQPRPQDAPPPIDLTTSASGTVVIEQYFSPETKEDFQPNADCGSLHEAYEVVVSDTAGNELATAALTGGTYEHEEEWGWTITRCTYDYRVTVPEAESYVFTLAESWDHQAVKDSATVTAEELRRDGAPTLRSESRYCPECP